MRAAGIQQNFSDAFPDKRIVHALHAQLSVGAIVKQAVSLLRLETDSRVAYYKRIAATLSQELAQHYSKGEWEAGV